MKMELELREAEIQWRQTVSRIEVVSEATEGGFAIVTCYDEETKEPLLFNLFPWSGYGN